LFGIRRLKPANKLIHADWAAVIMVDKRLAEAKLFTRRAHGTLESAQVTLGSRAIIDKIYNYAMQNIIKSVTNYIIFDFKKEKISPNSRLRQASIIGNHLCSRS
jgi:hypothetical protein